jgi:hypothetical protein
MRLHRPVFALSVLIAFAAPAWSQAVTLADLQGAVVHVGSVYQEKIVRDGRTVYPVLHTVGSIRVGPGESVTTTFTSSVDNVNGRSRVGQTLSGTYALSQPKKTRAGDDTVWFFANGSLVRLRVYNAGEGAGGNKMSISFRRGAGGIACSFSMPMARESGVGQIAKQSAIDSTPIQILGFKLTSSSCSVAR